MNDKPRVTFSSGNVFADLGFPESETELAKAKLVGAIGRIIERRRWTQVQAATALGMDESELASLLSGRFGGFSIDQLFRFLNRLDQDVAIVIAPRASTDGEASLDVDLRDEPIAAAQRGLGRGRATDPT
jgi:predicted XRE-type DNA-binding protein